MGDEATEDELSASSNLWSGSDHKTALKEKEKKKKPRGRCTAEGLRALPQWGTLRPSCQEMTSEQILPRQAGLQSLLQTTPKMEEERNYRILFDKGSWRTTTSALFFAALKLKLHLTLSESYRDFRKSQTPRSALTSPRRRRARPRTPDDLTHNHAPLPVCEQEVFLQLGNKAWPNNPNAWLKAEDPPFISLPRALWGLYKGLWWRRGGCWCNCVCVTETITLCFDYSNYDLGVRSGLLRTHGLMRCWWAYVAQIRLYRRQIKEADVCGPLAGIKRGRRAATGNMRGNSFL